MIKDLYNLKCCLNPPLYEWYRGVSGRFHHWEMKVLDGKAVLHIQGIDDYYHGHIQLNDVYDPDLPSIFTTENYDQIPKPEICARILELKWREMTFNESKFTFCIEV